MKLKLIIAGAILLIYIAQKKKAKSAKLKVDTEQLEFKDQLNIIRERLHEFLEKKLPYSNEQEIYNTVMNITEIVGEELNEEMQDEEPV